MKQEPQPIDRNRFKPQQERSRLAVDAILEAAAQVLERDGIAKFTTNAVAERAGVSIGSLYRYMANKEAILMELGARETQTMRTAIAEAFNAPIGGAPDRIAIQAFLGALGGRPKTRRAALIEMLSRTASQGDDTAWLEPLLLDQAGAPLAPIRAFVLARALLGAIRAIVLEKPELLCEQALEDELVSLARSYSNPQSGSRASPGTSGK